MALVVCQVICGDAGIDLVWSAGGEFFPPYTLTRAGLQNFRALAGKARKALFRLVETSVDGKLEEARKSSYDLAKTGFAFYNQLLPPGDPTADQVREWLDGLETQGELTGLELAIEDAADDLGTSFSAPWNIVYDRKPVRSAFLSAPGPEVLGPDNRSSLWEPFWGVRHNLACVRRVESIRHLPIWNDPALLVVLDPDVENRLPERLRHRLAAFLASNSCRRVSSLEQLESALEEHWPRIIYWLSHATPRGLELASDLVSPLDLLNLIQGNELSRRRQRLLLFLNACQTAESTAEGSFLEALHECRLSGMIATEQMTPADVACEFGMKFLEAFLRSGRPVGNILRDLRRSHLPYGLLYGTYCPLNLRTTVDDERKQEVGAGQERSGEQPGSPAAGPLPDEPYRSLASYERRHRALFMGRDGDIIRFAQLLDEPATQVLVLHGETGVGKSSFLRAGVIPYLEDECVGYRFLRSREAQAAADGAPDERQPVLFIQAAKDFAGQLARALEEFTKNPRRYVTPLGDEIARDTHQALADIIGREAESQALREALMGDASLLGKILTAFTAHWPQTLVLVIDQAEEIFTFARTPAGVDKRDRELKLIRQFLDVTAKVKLIIALRTEYYGRLLDGLRRGRRVARGLQDYLLTEVTRADLIQAIKRPTAREPIPFATEIPFEKYRFDFEEGVAERITDDILNLHSLNQESVLPWVQVVCTQLYACARSRSPSCIGLDDLKFIGGVEGGITSYVESAVGKIVGPDEEERGAFRSLFSGLFLQQADGSLVTAIVPRDNLASSWTGSTPFDQVLEGSKSFRLLRESSLQIGGDRERPYIKLGHDALARVAAAWREAPSRSTPSLSTPGTSVRDVIFCQVREDGERLVFTWGQGSSFFMPYSLIGDQLLEFREAARRARWALSNLVYFLRTAGSEPEPRLFARMRYDVAEAGYSLYCQTLPVISTGDSAPIREWLQTLAQTQSDRILEIVTDGMPWDIPWNLIYDEKPDPDVFRGSGEELTKAMKPFWGIRYNLCCGKIIDPLRRMALPARPLVLIVIEPLILEEMKAWPEAIHRLERLLAVRGFELITSLDRLRVALRRQPNLIYWFGHGDSDHLMLGDYRIERADLRSMLRGMENPTPQTAGLVFLNSPQSADLGGTGGFLQIFHKAAFGMIALEAPVTSRFANAFGLDFLEGFLEGRPAGELLWSLRRKYAPLGLVYGTYCPVELRILKDPDSRDQAIKPSPGNVL